MLEKISAYRLEVPLTKPYRLAFGAVERYDTIIVAATDREGRSGFGEATVLTGYTDETIDDAWQVAREFASRIASEPSERAFAAVRQLGQTHPFTASAFGTALEMLAPAYGLPKHASSVPILGLLDAKGDQAIAKQLETLLAQGYRTIKVKVGFDVAEDAAFIRSVQRAARSRVLIRVDANQGYTAEQAIEIMRGLDPQDIELFEQPCAAGDWDAHLRVARVAEVPLMLDESIYGVEDIEKAASLGCCKFIKLKLMKMVTLDALAAGLERIRALGMTPVLGNGVACDVGCWLEALVAAEHIDNAGEMNGFLKVKVSLLEPAVRFENGAIVLEPEAPALDTEALERYAIDSIVAAGRRAAGQAA